MNRIVCLLSGSEQTNSKLIHLILLILSKIKFKIESIH